MPLSMKGHAMYSDPVLETERVMYEYPGKILALNNVSIRIVELRKHVVLGSNGSGKSTLFLLFNGVLRPKSGLVKFKGSELKYNAKELAKLRQEVAVVMQNPEDQIFSSTVEEDVAFGPNNIGLDRDEVKRRVDEALALTGMENLRERLVYQLSFGQKKRVALAGALAMYPKVLILDEPTAGLDPQMIQWFLEFTEELHNRGITIVLSTHDVNLAYEWADVLHVLHNGQLLYSGSPEGFFENEQNVDVSNLSMPTIFDIHKRISGDSIAEQSLRPRTILELTSCISSKSISKPGKLYLMLLRDETISRDFPFMDQLSPKKGVYGILARKVAIRMNLPIDFLRSGLDKCLQEVLAGRDAILLIENNLLDTVLDRLRRLESLAQKGIDFEIMEV